MIKVEDVDGNNIKLPHGIIELCVGEGGLSSNYYITWDISYHRSDLELYKYETCSSLEGALDWYNNQDLSAKDL